MSKILVGNIRGEKGDTGDVTPAAQQLLASTQAAAGSATSARDEARTARNQAIEAMEAAQEVPTTTDGVMTSVLNQEDSAFRAGVSAVIVDSGNVPVDYTWDATTGFIATITEHYPAPIGNRVTTYSGYGTYGPTHEVDPDGGAWTLTYDANGNPIGRTAA